MGTIKSLDTKQFKITISTGVSLMDFNASWCAPCRAQKPVLEKLAEHFEDRALIGELDVDENYKLSKELGIMSIPTLIIFKDGEEFQRFIGYQDAEDLADALEDALT